MQRIKLNYEYWNLNTKQSNPQFIHLMQRIKLNYEYWNFPSKKSLIITPSEDAKNKAQLWVLKCTEDVSGTSASKELLQRIKLNYEYWNRQTREPCYLNFFKVAKNKAQLWVLKYWQPDGLHHAFIWVAKNKAQLWVLKWKWKEMIKRPFCFELQRIKLNYEYWNV